MHWTERSAARVGALLGVTSFAGSAELERLADFAQTDGVEIREEVEIDCLGEIRRSGAGWKMKILCGLHPVLRADVIAHEIGHRYVDSGMTAICSDLFHWWWKARDERHAALWCAHFRMPTDPLLSLLRKSPSREDLLAECQAPEGLLLLKLRTLHRDRPCLERRRSVPDPVPAPSLASQTLRARIRRIAPRSYNVVEQYEIGVESLVSGQWWALDRATRRSRLEVDQYQLEWSLVGWSEERFWRHWRHRLEPVIPRSGEVVWQNPKCRAG